MQIQRNKKKCNHINVTFSARRPNFISNHNTYLSVTERRPIDLFTAALPDIRIFNFRLKSFQMHV